MNNFVSSFLAKNTIHVHITTLPLICKIAFRSVQPSDVIIHKVYLQFIPFYLLSNRKKVKCCIVYNVLTGRKMKVT